MTTPAPTLPPIREGANDEIPVIDLGPYLAGKAGAQEAAAQELRHAFEQIGFYFVTRFIRSRVLKLADAKLRA